MKYRPSVSFLLCLLGIAVVEIEVVRTMGREISAPQDVPADQATLDYKGRPGGPKRSDFTKDYYSSIKANFAAGEKAKRKLLEEFSIFVFKGGDMPDKRNAYDPIRRSRELDRIHEGKRFPEIQNLPLATFGSLQKPEDFRAMLGKPEYSDLMAKIEHLATLPSPSSVEEARERFEGVSDLNGKPCIGALLNKAWIAADAKDESEALRLVEAAIRLSSHLDLLGVPFETYYLPAGRELIQENSLSPIIRSLGSGADLPRWRKLLSSVPNPDKSAWTDDLREGWHRRADLYIAERVDPVNAARAGAILSDLRRYSKKSERLIKLVERGEEYPQMRRLNTGEYFYESKVHVRNLVRRVNVLAAIDLLMLEKSGVTLDASSMDRISTGMPSGAVPRFDPAKRRILIPRSANALTNLPPLTVPDLALKEGGTSETPEK